MFELTIDIYGDNMISKNSSCHEKWCQTITDKEVYIIISGVRKISKNFIVIHVAVVVSRLKFRMSFYIYPSFSVRKSRQIPCTIRLFA